MSTICLGFETVAVENWADLVEMPEAPSNYKDAIKIEEYVQKARVQQGKDAKDRVFTGKLSKVSAIRIVDGHYHGLADVPVADAAMSVLESLQGVDRLVCVGLRLFLRFAVLQHISLRGNMRGVEWAVLNGSGVPIQPLISLLDPVTLLLQTPSGGPALVKGLGIAPMESISQAGICKRFGWAGPANPENPTADEQAQVAALLSQFLG